MPIPLPQIERVVLLMLENRSFDNVLGGFYPATTNPTAGGVPAGWSNPGPNGTTVAAWQAPTGASAQTIPFPDPQESYTNMSAQINTTPPMMGFVNDYATVDGATPADIMQYYSAANLPVTHMLATSYAVSDLYFASGPVQTWPNRLFSLCGTPAYDKSTKTAYLNNEEYPDYPLLEGQISSQEFPSIFDQFEKKGLSWKIYYGDEAPVAIILQTCWDNWHPFTDSGKVCDLKNFYTDCQNGSLPQFSLIEPRYQMLSLEGFEAPTSNHPGDSLAIGESDIPISVSCGERLLAQIFNALANSSQFNSTLLIVTYDEHGGLFDHVTPPAAVSPFPTGAVTNFNYNVYGVRVPALFINPFIQRQQPGSPQGVFRPPAGGYPFDHASILATLRDQFSLGESLTARVTVAPTFAGLTRASGPPINKPAVPVPACNWSWDSVRLGHAAPVLRAGLARSQRKKMQK